MLQVLRWSALVFGVFYGFSHQNAIYSKEKITATKHEWERKEQLIDQAKAEWKKRQDPSSQKSGGEYIRTASPLDCEEKRGG